MLRSVLPAFLLSLALPAAVSAQATDREGLSDLGEQMRDPAYQRDMALMLQAMTEVLLDMPVAPLAQAAAEIGATACSATHGMVSTVGTDIALPR